MSVPARADFTMTQNVRLIQDRGPFLEVYNNFAGWNATGTKPIWSWGETRYRLLVYRLKEGVRRYNYYIAVVNLANSNRHGPRPQSWAHVTIRSVRGVNYSTHSSGRARVSPERCRRYPVSLSAGFHGFSAGTTVGHLSTCRNRPAIHRGRTARGATWSMSQFAAMNTVTAHRYVRVRRGERPAFRVWFSFPCDYNDHGNIVENGCVRRHTVRY